MLLSCWWWLTLEKRERVRVNKWKRERDKRLSIDARASNSQRTDLLYFRTYLTEFPPLLKVDSYDECEENGIDLSVNISAIRTTRDAQQAPLCAPLSVHFSIFRGSCSLSILLILNWRIVLYTHRFTRLYEWLRHGAHCECHKWWNDDGRTGTSDVVEWRPLTGGGWWRNSRNSDWQLDVFRSP